LKLEQIKRGVHEIGCEAKARLEQIVEAEDKIITVELRWSGMEQSCFSPVAVL
jgi:hypothetical protein